MKKYIFVFLALFVSLILATNTAYAARPDHAGGGKPKPPSDDGGTTELVGYDVSYPQCDRRLPNDFYFAVVGVNGGIATTENPCLAEQLAWAKGAKDGSNQPKLQLYVNTANPAQESIYSWDSWPSSGNTPYGECAGERTNDLACSWQYGWNRSQETEGYFQQATVQAGLDSNVTSDYVWWLDVETMNSWQSGSEEALRKNVAALEGFAQYYLAQGASIGLYSTAYQWGEITGNYIDSGSNLEALPNWRPSGSTLNNAIANCSVEPLTNGGYISMTQYVKKRIDHNHSCAV